VQSEHGPASTCEQRVIRRHQASSGVIRRHQASSGVIRRHQAHLEHCARLDDEVVRIQFEFRLTKQSVADAVRVDGEVQAPNTLLVELDADVALGEVDHLMREAIMDEGRNH
jgi:hypothetical protein